MLRGRPAQHARLTTTLPADGEYRIIASTRDWNKTGAYTLTVVDGQTAARDRAALIANAPTYAQRASTYLENGENGDAGANYDYALRLQPNNPVWRNNLGVAEMRRGNPELAAIHFTETLRIDPENQFARNTIQIARQRQSEARAEAQREQTRLEQQRQQQQQQQQAERQRRQAEESQAWGRLTSGALTALAGGNTQQATHALSGQSITAPRHMSEEEPQAASSPAR